MSRIFPKKQLGQNFLVDPNITRKIISGCQLKPTDTVLEIGSGLGALTGLIAGQVEQLIAVETDQTLFDELKNKFPGKNIKFIKADFLKMNLVSLPEKLKVIGNLPYYISSAIIARILENRQHFSSLYLTVQYEFGKRLVAKVGTKDYSAFSCFVQYYSEPKILFRIKNSAFKPIPKVESCFMKLHVREKPLAEAKNEAFLFALIHHAFQQRRKTIPNALAALIDKETFIQSLKSLDINPQSRAENIALKNYVALSDLFYKQWKDLIKRGEGKITSL